jgi:AraC family transcriptional regulator of arabinose operon
MTPLRHFFAVPPLKSRRLALHGIGIREQMGRQVINRPAGTGDYLFMYFYDAVLIGTKSGIQKYDPGVLVLWRPQDGHYYGNASAPYKHSWMHCDGRLIRKAVVSNLLPFNTAIPVADATLIENYLFYIHEELTQYVRPSEKIVRNFIENWMCEISRVVSGDVRKQTHSNEMLALKAYVDASYHLPLTLEDLARRAHMSIPHLCSQFRRNFSTSVMAYVIGQRLQQAAYLLRDQNLRVTDVARQVGYDDLFYFSKLFRGRFGVSPRQFRNAVNHSTAGGISGKK